MSGRDADAGAVAEEQRHLDRVGEALEAMKGGLRHMTDGVADDVAGEILDVARAHKLARLEDDDSPPFFGRISGEERDVRIGRLAVMAPGAELLVVNWRAPAAAPFYRATPADAMGVRLRRRITIDDGRVVAVEDERLDAAPADAAGLAAAVRAATSERSAHMRHIVSTIRPEQYELIAAPADAPLVVQGGPGSGKTAVGLHRAALLLFQDADVARRGVLVIGPNPTFLRYVERVLPSLGERPATQTTIERLGPITSQRPEQDPGVARLKGELRMAELLRRALDDRLRADRPLELRVHRRAITIPGAELRRLMDLARGHGRHFAAAREQFRAELLARIEAELQAAGLGGRATTEAELRADADLARCLAACWPRLTPAQLVGDLLASPTRLRHAADGLLDADEQAALRRARSAPWTTSDVPLLDEARALLEGSGAAYGHVVVDEAQELSPLAVRMAARRARSGSVTLLGDLAQAAGGPPPGGWAALVAGIESAAPVVRELRVSYRVPREFVELAAALLPQIAPELEPPIGVHGADRPLELRDAGAGRLGPEAAALAARALEDGGLVAVVCTRGERDAIAAALALAGCAGAEVLDVATAKGLEFDHVVVADPGAIHAQDGPAGLYVALTRATRTMALVVGEPLPAALAARVAAARG